MPPASVQRQRVSPGMSLKYRRVLGGDPDRPLGELVPGPEARQRLRRDRSGSRAPKPSESSSLIVVAARLLDLAVPARRVARRHSSAVVVYRPAGVTRLVEVAVEALVRRPTVDRPPRLARPGERLAGSRVDVQVLVRDESGPGCGCPRPSGRDRPGCASGAGTPTSPSGSR